MSSLEVVEYNSDESGFKPCLVFTGKKQLRIVSSSASAGVTAKFAPLSERRYMRTLTHNGKPYPVSRAVKHMRNQARTHGITKAAALVLRR